MLVELTLFSLALLATAGYGFLSARFYLKVTKGISSHTVLAKLKNPVRMAAWALAVAVLVFIVLLVLIPVEAVFLAWTLIAIASSSLLLLLLAPFIALLSSYARERALASTEGKIARSLLIASFVFAKFVAKVLIGFAKLVSESYRPPTDKGRIGPGHYGYLDHTEHAKMKNGERF